MGLCFARRCQRGRRDRGPLQTEQSPGGDVGFHGAFLLANTASFFYTTRRGKFEVSGEVIDGLHRGGHERVLRMGLWAFTSSVESGMY